VTGSALSVGSVILQQQFRRYCLGIFVFEHLALRFKDAKELIIRKG
jgi:hypothetical protein